LEVSRIGRFPWNLAELVSVEADPERLAEGQGRSIEHLQGLYTVVAAVSVALAGEDFAQTVRSDEWSRSLPLIVAFLVTLVPFYHGTLLHLDKTYRATHPIPVSYGRLLFDFSFLFAEGCILILLAISITSPRAFAPAMSALLAVDVGWAFATSLERWRLPHDGAIDEWFSHKHQGAADSDPLLYRRLWWY
jgi:hypothetical protein